MMDGWDGDVGLSAESDDDVRSVSSAPPAPNGEVDLNGWKQIDWPGGISYRGYWRENLNSVRKLAEKAGGRYEGGIHFGYPGDQLRSMLSLTSYLGSGEYRERYLGVRIPATNISEGQLDEARRFAAGLADGVLATAE
jgi:hypothetical protein